MIEVLRTNDPIRLSYAVALLTEAGCQPHVMDRFTSAMEGSVAAIQRRILVPDEHAGRARQELKALETMEPPPPDWDPEGTGEGGPT